MNTRLQYGWKVNKLVGFVTSEPQNQKDWRNSMHNKLTVQTTSYKKDDLVYLI